MEVESNQHFILRIIGAVLIVDMIIFGLTYLICVLFGVGLSINNISNTLLILGIIAIFVGGATGGARGRGGMASYANEIEAKSGGRYRPSASFQIVVGGLIAIIASVVIPLVF